MRFMCLVGSLVLLMSCSRDFEAGTGYAPGPGYAGPGTVYSLGGSVLVDDAVDGNSIIENDTGGGEDQDTQVVPDLKSDTGCNGTVTYCTCMEGFDNAEYCTCKETETQDHPGATNWCVCHHLICVPNPDPTLLNTYLAQCVEKYPAACADQ